MAGYVLEGSPESIVLKLNAFLDKNQRQAEHLSDGVPGFWISHHPRAGHHEIELHHGMLVVS